MNKIYRICQILKGIFKSIFITLPKKPGATECILYRMTDQFYDQNTFKNHHVRVRNKSEIAGEQRRFVEGNGTANTNYIL